MIYIIIIIVLFIGCCVLGYTTFNALRKIERYEDFIESEQDKNETLLETLRILDNRQMFEKDDEVGSLFTQIKDTIERYKQF